MVLNIRRGFFLPDGTRSGIFVAGGPGKDLAEEYAFGCTLTEQLTLELKPVLDTGVLSLALFLV